MPLRALERRRGLGAKKDEVAALFDMWAQDRCQAALLIRGIGARCRAIAPSFSTFGPKRRDAWVPPRGHAENLGHGFLPWLARCLRRCGPTPAAAGGHVRIRAAFASIPARQGARGVRAVHAAVGGPVIGPAHEPDAGRRSGRRGRKAEETGRGRQGGKKASEGSGEREAIGGVGACLAPPLRGSARSSRGRRASTAVRIDRAAGRVA
jgi:hypothetical protein